MPVAALIPAAIGGVSALIQGKKAKKAADITSQAAAQQAAQTQKTGQGAVTRMTDMYTKGMEQYQPYTEMGTGAVKALSDFLNLSGGGPSAPAGFHFDPASAATDPSLDFRLREGQKAIERSAAAKGNVLSGGTAKALTQYSQDLASTEYQNMFNRALTEYQTKQQAQQQLYAQLFGVTGLGANAAQSSADFGQRYGQQAGAMDMATQEMINNLLMGGAGAQSSGQVAQGNAWANALNGVSNAVGGMVAKKNLSDLLGQQAGGGVNVAAFAPTVAPSVPSGFFNDLPAPTYLP